MLTAEKLKKIVNSSDVISDEATLNEYSNDMSFVNKIMPDYVVKAKKSDDIANLVKYANETLTPLVPVSSGPLHFRGDTIPSIGGATIVDLSEMKKIVRVDRQNRVALCEAGVTFRDLIPEIEKKGLRLNMPLLPRKSKSVVSSMLEREPPIMPKYHWDIADPLACVEIIFGTGDTFRTGSAAGPGTLEEQWATGNVQKEAAGPSQASWYRVIQGSQGTMGIVTWASMRCELLPQLEVPFLVGSSNLDKIMDLVHWLIRLRLVNECFILNNVNLSAIMAQKWPDDYQNLKETLPPWVLFYNVAAYEYFPEQRVKGQVNEIKELTQRIGLESVPAIGEVSALELLKTVQRPSEEPYWRLRNKGSCHDIFFITIYDKLQRLIKTMQGEADLAGYPSSDMGIYLQPIVQGSNCHCEFNLFFDPENSSESSRIRRLATSATKNLMTKGAFFSRPYGENTNIIINKGASTAAALRKVKTMFDPNNIMNPGKLYF